MFGLFKNKVSRVDIVISNIGFNQSFNHCRSIGDRRLHDDFSKIRYRKILRKALEQVKEGANDELLFEAIRECFEGLYPRYKFTEAADQIAKEINQLKGEDFKETKKAVIENRLNVNNIEESLKLSEDVSDES